MTIAKAPAGWLWDHSYDLHLLNVLRAARDIAAAAVPVQTAE